MTEYQVEIDKYYRILSNLDNSLKKRKECYEYTKQQYENNPNTMSSSLSLASDSFEYARKLLVKNNIINAKNLFQKGTQLIMPNKHPRIDIPLPFKQDYEIPLYIYLGGDREYSSTYIKTILPDFIKSNITSTKTYRNFQLLFFWFIIGDKEKINYYIQEILSKYNKNDFDEEGMPKSRTLSANSNAYGIYDTKMIQAIQTKDKSAFEYYCDLHSRLALKKIGYTSDAKFLADLELIILYDSAIGEGIHPNVNSLFIPKSILEEGYWNTILEKK